jgi:hypothetical protein
MAREKTDRSAGPNADADRLLQGTVMDLDSQQSAKG